MRVVVIDVFPARYCNIAISELNALHEVVSVDPHAMQLKIYCFYISQGRSSSTVPQLPDS